MQIIEQCKGLRHKHKKCLSPLPLQGENLLS